MARTQQGWRQFRYRGWADTKLTYNGDVMAAGAVTAGKVMGNYSEAEQYICRAISGRTDQNLMNLQAAAAQTLGVKGGWDSVGEELPLIAWDFTSGGTFPGLNYGTNVAGAISRDSLVYRNAGEARASSLGLLVEPQTSNKCTNTNMKPTDTTGTTPDAAWTTHEALALSSLPTEVLQALPDYTPGKLTHVYHSVSNAAGVITVDGVTGNTNPHTPSVWHYTVSGDFGCGLSGAGPSASPTSGAWERFEKPGTPAAGTETMVVGSSQASEVYWFGNQLEEGTTDSNTRTSLIEVAGATATRLGDNVFTNTSTGLNTASFTIAVEFQAYSPPPAPTSLGITLQLDNGSDLGATLLASDIRHTNLANEVRDNSAFAIGTASYVLGNVTTQAWGADGQGSVGLAFDGGDYVSGVYATQSAYSFTRFGSNYSSSNNLYGYIKRVALYDTPATQANCERLSA